MTTIVVYNTATGAITKCVTCPMDMADAQCATGEAWMEHDLVDDSQFKVDLDTGDIVAVETTENG